MKVKSLSKKRLILTCKINGKDANFLLDTGASAALIDNNRINEYNIVKGKKYNGTIIGAGGALRGVRYCDSFIDLPNGKQIAQFLLTDLSSVCESIKRQTDVDIVGIISLPQMQFAGITLDANSHEIILENTNHDCHKE